MQSRREKIRRMEEEIARTQDAQREYNRKQAEKIKELRRRISAETHQMELENNGLIAAAVRMAYGEVNEENINEFKEKMLALFPGMAGGEGSGEAG